MRVVLAFDKFAGTLSAAEAAAAVAEGWRSRREYDELVVRPMSDGGPGFLDSIASAAEAPRWVEVEVDDALGRQVGARVLVDGDTAWVESAQACGLHLLAADERDPERTTTEGVGQLLRVALDANPQRVVVGVGGTATNDGGRGLLAVIDTWPADVTLEVATDVDNPLLGINGASAVFGPQKGADAAAVQRLDAQLSDWVDGLDAGELAARPGAGAGGGLGFALMRLGAQRVSGIDTVLDATGLATEIEWSDLVLTGEGSYDFTSLRGKVVSGVAAAALDAAVPCVVIAGQVSVGRREAMANGVAASYSLTDLAGSAEAAQADAAHWARVAGERVAVAWGHGS